MYCIVVAYDKICWDDGVKNVIGPFETEQQANDFVDRKLGHQLSDVVRLISKQVA